MLIRSGVITTKSMGGEVEVGLMMAVNQPHHHTLLNVSMKIIKNIKPYNVWPENPDAPKSQALITSVFLIQEEAQSQSLLVGLI